MTKANVKDFLEISSRYGIEKLIRDCKTEWQGKPTKKNVEDVLNLAHRPEPSRQLKNKAQEIIPKVAVEVSTQTEEHVQLNEVAAADGHLEVPETVDSQKTEDNTELPSVADETVNVSAPVEISMSQEGQESKDGKLESIEDEGSSEVIQTNDEEQVELKTTEEDAKLADDIEKSAESCEDDPEDEPKPGVEKEHSLDVPATVVKSEHIASLQVQKEEFAYQKADENVEFPSVVEKTVNISVSIETSTELLTAQPLMMDEINVAKVEVEDELDMPEGDRQLAKGAAPDCDSSAEPRTFDVDTESNPGQELISSSDISTAEQHREVEETGEAVLQVKLEKEIESIVAANEKSSAKIPEELINEISGNSEVAADDSTQTEENDPANDAIKNASTLAACPTNQADETAKSSEEVTAKTGPKGKGKRNKRKY